MDGPCGRPDATLTEAKPLSTIDPKRSFASLPISIPNGQETFDT